MSTVEEKPAETTDAQTRHRSPNYPFFNLEAAIGKAKTLYKEIGRHPVGISILISKLGYTAKSSSGKKALGALRAFGLVDDSKAGRDQLVKLSGRALDIVADYAEGTPGWRSAVTQAARAPKIHAALLDHYQGTLPVDDELKRYLVRVYDPPFTDAGAVDFIAEIRSTLAFSGRFESSVDTAENGTTPEDLKTEVQVGAFVQWTSDGQDRFQTPQQVVEISEDGEWAFTEGSETGLPMSELSVCDPPTPAAKTPPSNRHYRPQNSFADTAENGMELERKTLDEGAVVLQWPATLSEDSVDEFEHWIQGVLRRARRKAGLPARKKPK